MHPALWKLSRLQVRARFRRWARGLKTKRGIIFTGAGFLLFSVWLLPPLLQGLLHERSDPTIVRTNFSLGLLAMCVLNLLFSSGGKAIVFSPAELDFLFPGPFRRRDLLVYKLLGSVATSVVMGLLFGTVFLRYATYWVAAFAGIIAAYLFVQLFDMTLAMSVQWIGELAYNRARRLVALAAVVLLVVALVPAVAGAKGDGLKGFADGARSSAAGRVVLAPFDVYGRAITAERLWPDLPLWTGLALLIDLAVVGLILRLDANYQEASYVGSQKRYEAIQRARSGGGSTKMTAGWKLPRFPRLAGAGPVARRQALHLLRSSPRLLLVLVLMSLGLLPTLFFANAEGPVTPIVLPVLGWTNFMLVMMFPFGFRGDVDHLDWFKSLPLRPAAIVLGETLPLTFFLAGLNGIVLIALIVADQQYRLAAVAAAALDLPVVVMAVALENVLFLAFPFRPTPGSQSDPQQMGRLTLLMFFRMIALLVIAAAAVGLGFAAYVLAGDSWIAAGVMVLAALVGTTALFVWLAAVLFERFDISVDSPA